MNLAPNNFSKHTATFRGTDGITREGIVHTYESRSGIYHVLVLGGSKFIQHNMGDWKNTIDAMKPIHFAIESHFNI